MLIVHHDVDVGDIQANDLRRAGYEVDQCAGPIGSDACPVLRGEPCWQVEQADVLIYDFWASGDGRPELIEDVRELHPDKPVVATSGGMVLDWAEAAGRHGVTPALGPPDQSVLAAAVEAALRGQVTAPRGKRSTRAARSGPSSVPRW